MSCIVSVALCALVLACDKTTEPEKQPEPVATSVAKLAGDEQSGVVGTPVASAPSVRTMSSSGQAVRGVAVTFSIVSGGGSVTGANAVTDASGLATVGGWTLGTTAGVNELSATVTGLAPVTFRATGRAGAAATAAIHEGNAQSARIGGAVSIAPAVRVRDQHGNAVTNASVTFTALAGGGSVVGANATSNAEGIARVGSWTLGAMEGANTLTATVAGVPAVTFSATAFDPWNYIVSDEAPECPLGGPIYRIRGNQISVLAQGGLLKKPRGMVLDGTGNLIVADGLAGLLKVSLSSGAVTRIAYGPPFSPRDVAIDRNGDYIVVESPATFEGRPVGMPAVYRVTSAGVATVVAQDAQFELPHGLVIDAQGNYIVSDGYSGLFRVTPQGAVTLVARTTGPASIFGSGTDVALDSTGNYIIADGRGALLRITPTGTITVIRQGPPFSIPTQPLSQGGTAGPRGVVVDDNRDYVLVDWTARAVFRTTPTGQVTTTFQGAPLCGPADLVLERRTP